MPLEPHNPEFARLATRWLDGVATRDEAERLWEAILASKECAVQFAAHARFESLLEHTYQERARENVVTGAVSKATRRHHQRVVMKMAAVLGILGLAVGMLWPRGESSEIVKAPVLPSTGKPEALQPVHRPAPTLAMQPMRLLVPTSPGATDVKEDKPLPVVLDEFFLTAVSLDRVPLREALQRLETQLRLLNYGQSALLAGLRATLPAGAANSEVTFHSGAISYLKAVRAIAALANCEVLVSDTGLALTSMVDSNRLKLQDRTLDSLLANDGRGLHNDRGELLQDARALGMLKAGDLNTPSSLSGTQGQFEALAELADSRRQVRNLPDIGVLPFIYSMEPGEKARALTEKEAQEQLRIATQNGTVSPEFLHVKPGTGSGAFSQPGGPDLLITAVPAGPYIQVSIIPNQDQAPTRAPVFNMPVTDIIVPRIGGAFLPSTGPIDRRVSVGASPPSQEIAMANTYNGTSGGAMITMGDSVVITGSAMSLSTTSATTHGERLLGISITNGGLGIIIQTQPQP